MNFPKIRPAALSAAALLVVGLPLGLYARDQRASRWTEPPTKKDRAAASAPPYQSEGTRRMAERLKVSAESADSYWCRALGAERVQSLRDQLKQAGAGADPKKRMNLLALLSDELLNAGETDEALKVLDQCDLLARAQGAEYYRKVAQNPLRKRRAMCHLRLGEQQNCCANANADSCLLPIKGAGIHTRPDGSREGIRLLTEQLGANPTDKEALWSLNIAHMTLGEYPAGVPARYRIPPSAFRSEAPLPAFRNAGEDAGLALNGLAGGCALEDFDRDGDLDALVSRHGPRDPLRYFENDGHGRFAERTEAAGLSGLTGGMNLVQADYNNDGYPDVLVLRGSRWFEAGRFPKSLLRNNGDGTFDDVTEAAGLLKGGDHPSKTAVWFDYNGDGRLDLFVGSESMAHETPHPSQLYRNNGDGTFTECARENGLAVTLYVTDAVSADYDNDGRPDLYLSFPNDLNLLMRNGGPANAWDRRPSARWRFTDVSKAAGVAEPMQSGACFFFDYDNDGWQDLFVSGFNGPYPGAAVKRAVREAFGDPDRGILPRLYRNRRDGTFEDATKAAHLDRMLVTVAANYGDIDNDGFLDFYVGTGAPELNALLPNRMFRNNGAGAFQDVTVAGNFGHLQRGSAISFGDVDNDGDQDVYEVMGGVYAGDVAHNALYRNPGGPNHWLTLSLEGVRSNRSALGARIKVTVAMADGGERAVYKTVSSGGSFGASPLRQEIGLGAARGIRSVEVFWPATGKTESVRGAEMDGFYAMREGTGRAVPVGKAAPVRMARRSPGRGR